MSSLTDQQIRFCQEYLVDFNASAAAIRAGYSRKSAASQAARLLTNVNIQAYLSKLKIKTANKLEISRERTMLELARIGYGDIRNLFDDGGTLKDIKTLDADTAAMISSVEIDELFEGRGEERRQIGFTKKIKLWPKLPALELFAKHYGIVKEAPPPANVFDMSSLTAADLKMLLVLKQKAGK